LAGDARLAYKNHKILTKEGLIPKARRMHRDIRACISLLFQQAAGWRHGLLYQWPNVHYRGAAEYFGRSLTSVLAAHIE
jgi:hypothetical protein